MPEVHVVKEYLNPYGSLCEAVSVQEFGRGAFSAIPFRLCSKPESAVYFPRRRHSFMKNTRSMNQAPESRLFLPAMIYLLWLRARNKTLLLMHVISGADRRRPKRALHI